jgi:ABC-type glycerol-3-phosphate transport system substrate-binding protein
MDSWIYSNGGKIIDDAGKAALINSPESVAALEHYVSLLESAPPGTPNREEGESINLFTSGKVAMGLFGSWQQDTIKQRGPDMKWDLAMCPAPDGKQFRGTLGGWSMSIFKASKNPEAAWKYVEFLTHKDVQKTVNSLIPARNDAGKEFVEALRKRPDVILKTVDTGLPRPISPVYPQISEVQQSMMQDIWANKQVKPAADKAAKDIEKVLQS